ncbi:conjugal transfer protein TraW [uncultured Parasutterella sp.]|uniref:conjugal transfer protein TraW n=1 Tax=uncultured Parasutterella sp. TaxID=1263098 RepID=UPI0025888D2A|nr:conjugal transfer protein TraW [uncultured Parasutterella sp.]
MKTSQIAAGFAFIGSIALFTALSAANAESDSSLRMPKPQAAQPCAKPRAKLERLPTLGPLTEVIEPNILEAFKKRVRTMKQDGSYDRRFEENKTKIRKSLETPQPAIALSAANALRVWDVTPSIPERLPEKLLRESRKIELPRIPRALLFINANDEQSLKAAEKLIRKLPDVRVVLTSGSIADASERLSRRIFFDQGSSLVRSFGIRQVPALLFNGETGPRCAEFPADEPELVLPYLRS